MPSFYEMQFEVSSTVLPLKIILFLAFFASRKAIQVTGFMSFNTGLVVQYSNDNGILWHLLRELDFMSFLEPQIISIDLPRESKTPATAFRWWQPQHGKLLLTSTCLVAFNHPVKATSYYVFFNLLSISR